MLKLTHMQIRAMSHSVAQCQTKRFRKCTHLISTWLHARVKLTVIRFFSSLGALSDFSDTLIEYAYDRQASCDPGLQAYYFECLQVVTEGRYSEQLQTKVAMLQSQDVVSRRDLSAAYRSLNISVAESRTISDERIIEKYQAHQPDLGAVAQEEARAHLYKIGVARNSQTLIRASRQSVDTYDDALSWFGNGVNKDTSDEGILAVFSIKVSRSFLDSKRVAWQHRLIFTSDDGKQVQRRNRTKSHLYHRPSAQE